MKITEQRIRQIIVEELKLAEQDEAVSTKQELSKQLLNISKLVPKAEGIDRNEAKLIFAIIKEIIQESNDDNAKQKLITVLNKLGEIK